MAEAVAPLSLCLEKIFEGALRLTRLVIPVGPALAPGSDPPPLTHDAALAEEAGGQRHSVEPMHVAGWIYAGEEYRPGAIGGRGRGQGRDRSGAGGLCRQLVKQVELHGFVAHAQSREIVEWWTA
jgi:hypothetical protein